MDKVIKDPRIRSNYGKVSRLCLRAFPRKFVYFDLIRGFISANHNPNATCQAFVWQVFLLPYGNVIQATSKHPLALLC